MTEAEKQRARVDALIAWAEETIALLNYYGPGALAGDQLTFPDPYPTPESKPRRDHL